MTVTALIVAAGRGARASLQGQPPKQYASLAGEPVLARAIAAFEAVDEVREIVVVIHPDDRAAYEAATADRFRKLAPPVLGGATRQASVRQGLESLVSRGPSHAVLIHDAARPFVDAATIRRVLAAIEMHDGAIAAVPLPDTLKRVGPAQEIEATVPRAGLWKAQTPQGFRLAAITAAHRAAADRDGPEFTDDAAIAEWAGLSVALVAGSERNFKITTAEDLAMADALLSTRGPAWETRTGTGFDVHAFTAGDHVWLGGVRIPHDQALEGHSDADAPLHALTDALLGAIGDGDIGQHFPPSDPQWKGARSRLFVEDAVRRIRDKGGRITNVDLTLLCEAPRIGPHREAIRAEIADMLGVSLDRVAVKATTTERLGFTGRREGLAALATATVLLPL